MRPTKKIDWRGHIPLFLVIAGTPVFSFFVDQYGLKSVTLSIVGVVGGLVGLVFLVVLLFKVLDWIDKPVRAREIEYEYSRKVQVPPEFFFSTFWDAEFRQRISGNLLDIYIDQEEMGGYIVSTFQTPKGIETNCTEITNWNPPFELGTQITLESHAGSATTIHNYHFEKIPTGTFYKVQSRFVYTGIGRLSFMITKFTLKRSLKKNWTKITNEAEKEYIMRKNREMAV